jgi:hypothetical protein
MTGRREFITLLGAAAAGWPLTARAQHTLKAARIGYLAFRSPMSADDAFFQGLRDFGWMEGQNIFVERRFAAGNIDQLKDSAAELVHLKVDVIVTAATAATQAAKDATASISARTRAASSTTIRNRIWPFLSRWRQRRVAGVLGASTLPGIMHHPDALPQGDARRWPAKLPCIKLFLVFISGGNIKSPAKAGLGLLLGPSSD